MRAVLKAAARIYRRDTALVAATAVFAAYINYFLIKNFAVLGSRKDMGALLVTRATLRLSALFFVFYAFVSYFYFDKTKSSSFGECAEAVSGGTARIYGGGFLILSVISVFTAANMLGYNLAALAVLRIGKTEAFCNVGAAVLFYILAVSLCGILFGMAVSLYLNRFAACAVMFSAVLATSPASLYMVEALYYSANINLFGIYEFLCIYGRNTAWRPVYSAGYPVTPDRIAATAFWMSAFCVFIFYGLNKKNVLFAAAAITSAVLAVVCACVYGIPMTRTLTDMNPKGAYAADMLYYEDASHVQKNKDGGFYVEEYDIRVKTGLKLSAVASVKVSKKDLDEYCFTLYHGYDVKDVRNRDGRRLSYTREGDYLTVEAINEPTEEITVEYEGISAACYAGTYRINLPGHFAYYPQSGFKIIYDNSTRSLNNCKLDVPAFFRVSVDCGRTVYSNLEAAGGNVFCGYSDGCTLMAGMLSEEEISGVKVVYPYLDTEQFEKGLYDCDIANFLALKKDDFDVKKIIILPYINIGPHIRCIYYSDGTIVCAQPRTLAADYEAWKLSQERGRTGKKEDSDG